MLPPQNCGFPVIGTINPEIYICHKMAIYLIYILDITFKVVAKRLKYLSEALF